MNDNRICNIVIYHGYRWMPLSTNGKCVCNEIYLLNQCSIGLCLCIIGTGSDSATDPRVRLLMEKLHEVYILMVSERAPHDHMCHV